MRTRVVTLSQVHPNPHRDMDRYPILEEKIDRLQESIQSTGFWENIIARPTQDGVELAYGHHRLEALRREFPPDHEIEIIVRDLTDSEMLKIMARENDEAYHSTAWAAMETVRAVVLAYAGGVVDLERPPEKTKKAYIRYAPSFVIGEDVPVAGPAHPYTGAAVARFLGWIDGKGGVQKRVETALRALEAIEREIMEPSDFAALGIKQAQTVVRESWRRYNTARAKAELKRHEADTLATVAETEDGPVAVAAKVRAEKAAKDAEKAEKAATVNARVAGKAAAVAFKTAGGSNAARRAAQKAVTDEDPGPPPMIDKVAQGVARKISKWLWTESETRQQIDELVRWRGSMANATRDELHRALIELSKRAAILADALDEPDEYAPQDKRQLTGGKA